MIYGYCRISTAKQNIARQERNILAEYPNAHIIRESYTGTTLHRPAWEKLEKSLKQGDIVIFDSVSRMSRSAADGVKLYEVLFDRGIDLIFLKEHYIDTATYKRTLENSVPMTGTAVDLILNGINSYLKELARAQVKLAFNQSEKEVADLHQRTREGIQTARLNGKQIGQRTGVKLITKKSVTAKETILKHSSSFGGTLSDGECMQLCGVSRNSYYKYKKELQED